MDHPVPYTDLIPLLQSCVHIKHLQIPDDIECDVSKSTFTFCSSTPIESAIWLDDLISGEVHLRKLEVLVSSHTQLYRHGPSKTNRRMNRDLLISSQFLRVFSGSLRMEDLLKIDAQRPLNNIFSKLAVLDLQYFTTSALEILANIDNFQLEYLRLGKHYRIVGPDELNSKERSRNALHKLLPKLVKLKMLTIPNGIGVTNATIELLTDLEPDLSSAALFHAYSLSDYEENEDDFPFEMEPLQADVLIDFRTMLLSKNPAIDLSEIHFVLLEGAWLKTLEAMNTGFTFLKMHEYYHKTVPSTDLHDPKIKLQFGIDF